MNIYIAIFAVSLLGLLPGCGKKNNQTKESHKKEHRVKKSKRVKNDTVLEALNLGDLDSMDNFAMQTVDENDQNQSLQWQDDQSIRRTPNGQFKQVYFDFNDHSVRADQEDVVNEDTKQAKKVLGRLGSTKKLVVEGHSSPETGSATYNLALSQKRAENVKAEHVKRGIPAENITTVGRGKEMPVIKSDSKEANWPNRRVEEYVINN